MLLLLATVLVIALFMLLSSYSSKTESTQAKEHNVILISANLLRPDHMSCYGYHRNTTPNICSVAEDGIIFEQAVSPATWSLPAYGSLFTSQYPSAHGLRKNKDRLSKTSKLLSGQLKKEGYRTAAFVGSVRNESGQLRPIYGFDRGFDTYHAKGHLFTDTIPPAKKWISKNKDKEFFLFLHGQDIHYPWHYPENYQHKYSSNYSGVLKNETYRLHMDYSNDSRILDNIRHTENGSYLHYGSQRIPLSEEDISHIKAHYDGGLLYTDQLLGSFLDWLKEQEMYENTTIIVTSDHGTTIGDRVLKGNRVIGHGKKPFDEQIRTPLIIKPAANLPTPVKKEIGAQVSLIDIMPTILDITGVGKPEELQGKSLEDLVWSGELWQKERQLFAETARTDSMAVRTDQWKLIDATNDPQKRSYLLYNLTADPDESENVLRKYPEVAERMRAYIEEQKIRNLEIKTKSRSGEKN